MLGALSCGLTLVCSLGCGPDDDVRFTNTEAPFGGGFGTTSGPPPSAEDCALTASNASDEALPEPPEGGPLPHFSFFVTSQAGLYSLGAGETAPAPDPARGFGGDFGGLAGADEICRTLARRSNPGDAKVWRAFLSSSGSVGERVDAIDRIGEGPWYDKNGRLLAENRAGLLEGADGRPLGAEPQLAAMFTDENGDGVRPPGQDNHDILTGSNSCGRLYDDGESGRVATCEDWTSSSVRGREGNLAGIGGQVPVGHSWPRGIDGSAFGDAALGGRWISDHTINGCEPGYDVDGGAGAPAGDFRVGAGGGYGGIYCFALGAVAP